MNVVIDPSFAETVTFRLWWNHLFLASVGQIFRGKPIAFIRKTAARIQNRFAPNTARWLRTMRAPGEPDYVLAQQFDALLHLLKENDCSFHNCIALGSNPVPRGVSFRYDIHLRDLAPAHDFLAFHLRENIPATFFLMWDHSNTERRQLSKFRAFAKKTKPPVEIGLHDSPVDAFLVATRFSGDAKPYRRWTQSDEIIAWLSSLDAEPDELAAFHTSVLERFKTRVGQTRAHFGNVNAVAAHGGELIQGLRPRFAQLEPALRDLAGTLFARPWLTQTRVSASGLIANVESAKGTRGWKEVSDQGGSRIHMREKIRGALGANNAVQLLIHPYAWLKREP